MRGGGEARGGVRGGGGGGGGGGEEKKQNLKTCALYVRGAVNTLVQVLNSLRDDATENFLTEQGRYFQRTSRLQIVSMALWEKTSN